MIQPDLLPAAELSETDKNDRELLLEILKGAAWMTAVTICNIAADNHDKTWSDRRVRCLASLSEGCIISGQAGYRLTIEATISEVQHAANWLRHQATEMHHRALEIDRVYHRKQTAIN
jgi:Tfp pilus assembly protein PilN